MGSPLAVRAVAGSLVWGADGSVWACWWVDPMGYPHRSVGDAADALARTTGALLALPRHSLIVSMSRPLSRSDLERRLLGAVEPATSPGWTAHARRLSTQVAAEGVHERTWLLAVRLPDNGPGRRVWEKMRVAASEVGGGFGITHSPPTRTQIVAAGEAASGLGDQLGRHLGLRRPTARQLRWVLRRAVLRGLIDEQFPAPDADRSRVSVTRLDGDAVYYEGGRRYDRGRPRHWRYATVEHPDHGTAHQTFACLAETPPSWTFPYGAGEWLWHLDDQLPFPLDWALRIERVNNDSARRKALRAKRNLVGQLTEPGGDPAGPATTLGAAVDAVDEHRSRLEANPALPAFRATTIVALAHRSLELLERRAAVLESTFRAAGHNFYRPTGAQLECLAAMLPGSAVASVVAEYAQDLLPDGLASAMPFAASGVGDPQGMLLGRSLDTQYPQAVLLDPAYPPRDLNRSGSLAAVGELGSGKSFLAKTLAWNTVAMGGQVVSVDRTDAGEYARLASVVTGSAQVTEITEEARVCLDPFRVFDTDSDRLRYGVGFITLLTGTPPASAAGVACQRAAQAALDQAHHTSQVPRLRDVVEYLDGDGPPREIADKLRGLASVSYGRLVFGDEGPVVDLDADYMCFHVPGLRLPRRGGDRADVMPEELIGQAVLYLVAAFSRRVLFGRPDRFAALLLDEAHALTANPQGRALVADLIRDGRKHYAAVWAFTQLPGDLTATEGDDESLSALLGYRAVFRQSAHTAPGALEFLGSDDRQANVDTVTALGTGQCLLSDPIGRLGLVGIAPPADPAVAAAFSTTPLADHEPPLRWPSLNGHTNKPVRLQESP